jgi:hypothetical protein
MRDQSIFRTNDLQKRVQWYEQSSADAPLAAHQFVAGFVQHPTTRLYQVWLSTNGFDLIYLSTHRKEEDAEKDVQAIKSALSSQDIYDEAKLAALFQRLESESDETPELLPDELVKHIVQAIAASLPFSSKS